MDLREFVRIMHSDIDAFENYWIENNDKRSAHFPMQMGEGDWYEQFLAFEETNT